MIKTKIIVLISIILIFPSTALAQEFIKSFTAENKFEQLNEASKKISSTINSVINSADFSDKEQKKNAVKLIESLTAQQQEIKKFADSMFELKKASSSEKLWEFADGIKSGEKEMENIQEGIKAFNAIIEYANSADKMRDRIVTGEGVKDVLGDMNDMVDDLKDFGKSFKSLYGKFSPLVHSSIENVEIKDEKNVDMGGIEDICRDITNDTRDSEFKSTYTDKYSANIVEAKAKITHTEAQINSDYEDADRLFNLALEAKEGGDLEKSMEYLKEAREYLKSAEEKKDKAKQYAELSPVLKLDVNLPEDWEILQQKIRAVFIAVGLEIAEEKSSYREKVRKGRFSGHEAAWDRDDIGEIAQMKARQEFIQSNNYYSLRLELFYAKTKELILLLTNMSLNNYEANAEAINARISEWNSMKNELWGHLKSDPNGIEVIEQYNLPDPPDLDRVK